MELVSILIATFNAQKYIVELLESVRAQTYKNIELVIADDCSTDDTQQLIREWLTKTPDMAGIKVKLLFAEENQGTCRNYNKGIACCEGKYIKIIDGDDLLLPECIELLMKECTDKKLELLVGDVMWVQDDGVTYAEHYEDAERKERFYQMSAAEQYRELLKNNDIIISAGEIFSKEFMMRFSGFDEEYDVLEDYPFWLKITKNGVKISFLSEKVAKYRISTTSVRNPENETFIYNKRTSKASKRSFYRLRLRGLMRENEWRLIFRNVRKYFIRDLVIALGNSNKNKFCRLLTVFE